MCEHSREEGRGGGGAGGARRFKNRRRSGGRKRTGLDARQWAHMSNSMTTAGALSWRWGERAPSRPWPGKGGRAYSPLKRGQIARKYSQKILEFLKFNEFKMVTWNGSPSEGRREGRGPWPWARGLPLRKASGLVSRLSSARLSRLTLDMSDGGRGSDGGDVAGAEEGPFGNRGEEGKRLFLVIESTYWLKLGLRAQGSVWPSG